MALTATLGTALDATSNNDPNSLTTPAPYTDATAIAAGGGRIDPSAAWTSQAKAALFPLGTSNGAGDKPLKVAFVPSGGAAVTYTVTLWMFCAAAQAWFKAKDNNPVAYTGGAVDFVDVPGNDAIYFQLTSISTGTISIYFDASNARKG